MKRRVLLTVLAAGVGAFAIGAGLLYWFLSGAGIRSALEAQATAWLGQPVRIGSASARLLPRVSIHLTDIRAGDPVRLTLAEVDLSTDLRALLGRRIENAEIIVSRSRIDMPLPFALPGAAPARTTAPPPAGSAAPQPSSPVSADGGGSTSPLRLVSVRTISLRDVRLVSRGREITVAADSSLDGTELQVRRFTATAGTTALEASGVVQLVPRIDGQFRVTANELDVDELLALAGAFTAAPVAGQPARARTALPIRLAARISAETARAGGVAVRQFATDFQVEGDTVALSPMTFQLFGGRYQGSLNATLAAEGIAATWRARVTGLDVALLAAHGGVADTVTGQLSGAATVTGRGPDLDSVLRSAKGSGSMSVTDGSIRRLDLIRTVVLFFGRPDPGAAGSGDRFQRFDASFTLASQVVHADAVALHSGDVDIAGSGSFTIPTKVLDGALDLSLSEALSAQAGTDLARFTREGSRIVLPARISGTLDRPRLSIDASAAVRRGLRNEVERRLRGILEGFGRPQ